MRDYFMRKPFHAVCCSDSLYFKTAHSCTRREINRFAKKSVNNNSSKLKYIKPLKPTSISEKTIKSNFFCDVVLPLFTVGDNFELRLIIKSGLQSLILTLFFFNHSVSAFVYYSLVKDLSETKLLAKWLLIEGFFDPLSLLTTSDTN